MRRITRLTWISPDKAALALLIGTAFWLIIAGIAAGSAVLASNAPILLTAADQARILGGQVPTPISGNCVAPTSLGQPCNQSNSFCSDNNATCETLRQEGASCGAAILYFNPERCIFDIADPRMCWEDTTDKVACYITVDCECYSQVIEGQIVWRCRSKFGSNYTHLVARCLLVG